VGVLCEVLEVSRSGYYAWRDRPKSVRQTRQETLLAEMQTIHGERYKECYGSPRMHRELRARGWRVSENTVARLMQAHGLRAATSRKFRHTTDSNHTQPVAENVLQRDFRATRPNEKWVMDITFVWTQEGWLYLAAVEDLYSRKVVGWSLGERPTSDLAADALRMALGRQWPGEGLLAHSDRGSQYASAHYQALLASRGITCSMSRRGNCWDNAPMESFFATLKKELVYQTTYATRAAAQRSVFEYIEVFYNRQRKHSALGYMSPCEYEAAALSSLEPHPQRQQRAESPSSPPVIGRHSP